MANQDLVVGELRAGAGEKTVGQQAISVLGSPYNFPVFLINGAQQGPTLAVTAGVHGGEYASIAAALELAQQLQPAALKGRVIIVPVVNGPGFRARSIYICPLDGVNINRVFPGKADGGAAQQIADWVFRNVIQQADYFVDLHGGDLNEALIPFTIYSRTGNAEVDRVSLEMAKVFGIEYLVRSESIAGSSYAAASHAGVPSILTESGAQGIWRPEDVALHRRGLERLLLHFGMIDGAAPEPLPVTLLDQFVWMRSDHEGFWYPGTRVDELVRKGQELGHVKDFQGAILQTAVAPVDGRVLFMVSSLAMNKGDPLLAVGRAGD